MASTLKGPSTELDSQPINFDTFVPTHDPSLAGGLAGAGVPAHPPDIPGPSYAEYYLPHPPGPMVSQDEAFQRALAAMYWGGYWTAVYHVSTISFIYLFIALWGHLRVW